MFDAIFPKHWTTLQRLMWLKTNALARAVYEIVTGNPVSFSAKAAPLRKLSVAFSPVQSGTGDPSPDNVRPISGWSEVTVEQRGKNLLEKSIEQFTNVPKELASCFFLKAGSYTASFDSISNATSWRFAIMMRDSDGNNLSDADHKPNPYMAWNTTIQGWLGGSNSTTKNVSFTLVDDCYIRVVLASGDTSASTAVTNGMLNIGSTAEAYTPYNPLSRSISISLGQTVYSGWVDVISGVGEVTWAAVDLGTLRWQAIDIASSGIYRMNTEDLAGLIKRPASSGILADIICESYATITGNQVYLKNTGIGATSSGYVAVYDPNYNASDSAAAFKASVNGVKLVYALATPIPIQLTPQEVQSLLGVNNMWSDANGNLTVEYRSN